MTDHRQQFFSFLAGKRISVIGVGVSNTDTARLLCRKGACVTVHDRRERSAIGEETCMALEAAGARLRLGEDYLHNMECDIIIRAPGVYFLSDFLQEQRKKGVIVTSEMELFFDLCPCRTFAVTGSDGKTTTTSLIAELLRAAGYTVHLGGNIGRALLPEIEHISPDNMAVVELSSFQLLSMRCAPDVSVVTNVTPNHLDVHRDMQEYTDAKRNIYLHQNAFSKTVLNFDNDVTRSFCSEVRGRCYGFSRKEQPPFGAFIAEDHGIYLNLPGGQLHVMQREELQLPGDHNVENFLAAISAVSDFVDPQTMRDVAHTFAGVEHRMELVRELNGVRWYNDSIASSPTRTIAGLRIFDKRIILIAGGYDKKIPYLPLAPEINRHVKTLILMGATAAKIEQAVREHPTFDPSALRILHASDLAQAVQLARETAQEGDIVSLSPASASFDLYPNFEVRGRHFKELVHALKP